jgi:alkylhydroperoxidase family enzyme
MMTVRMPNPVMILPEAMEALRALGSAERAALALAEALTRLNDREDPIDDNVWGEAAKHSSETELAGLLAGVAAINVWNRFNVATRQQARPGVVTCPAPGTASR